ncbi:hypothetical protein ACFVYV_37565 [Streptomyces mirabilis]|uniref:hypothetical protein n=1 Tax=Streptomyces mirabilis TaxID=68239 RepID=UPI0036DBEA89
MGRVPRAKTVRPSNTVRPASTEVTSGKSADSGSSSRTSEDADSDTEGSASARGWFHSERVRPAGFRDEVTWALRHRGRHLGLIPCGCGHRDRWGATTARGYCAGPPSYGTRSRCERLLGRTGTASLAEATARARARQNGLPRPSPADLDHFAQRHPGR